MRIGLFTPYLDTLTGGELYMLTIAEFLSRKHQVSIFWNDKDILNKASKRFDLDLGNIEIVENIFSSKISVIKKNFKTLEYDRIIYLSDGSLPSIPPHKLIVHFQVPLLAENISFIEKKKVSYVKKIICNSKFTKEFIDKAFGIDSEILYPPVQKINTNGIKKENNILTVGRYQPYSHGGDYKKLGFMIDIFKKFHYENKKWKMKIVTSVKTKDEGSFKENIISKVDESIEIIKNADFEDISSAYASSKIYWHAAGFGENIDKNPERAEHFGMSTVEAMSAGCVPIVINQGGQKEVVENEKNGFLWNTSDELINTTERVIKDRVLMDNISNAAENSLDSFSKERFYKQLEKLI